MPQYADRTANYELGFKEPGTLVIRVRESVMTTIRSRDFSGMPKVGGYSKYFGFSFFTSPNVEQWGFENVFRNVPTEDPQWHMIECELPVFSPTEEDEVNIRRRFFAVRATLEMLFLLLMLSFDQVEAAPEGRPQLMVVEGMLVRACGDGGALSVMLTPAFVNWLGTFEDQKPIPEVEQVMCSVHDYMIPKYAGLNKPREFRAYCRAPNRLYMNIPGNACNMTPDVFLGHNLESKKGYLLGPHNIDTSQQQLTFLSALSKLHDLARAAGV